MKYFPKYRIYSILGYLVPFVGAYYLLGVPDIHIIWKILLFFMLYPILFIVEGLVWAEIGKVWNLRQRSLENRSSSETKKEGGEERVS